ncbi:hypothetical protein [Paraburkholderia humisilvae]|uniref:hypothetical protein n=1 Tax=Paraburkholderia humisilvae TaxID=627669 RepID=UPI0015841D7B|nr:hypothetical protein [Paraburkholderia humisilvae]
MADRAAIWMAGPAAISKVDPVAISTADPVASRVTDTTACPPMVWPGAAATNTCDRFPARWPIRAGPAAAVPGGTSRNAPK